MRPFVQDSEGNAQQDDLSGEIRETCWPNEEEVQLLQAGLWPQARALTAWNNFCDRTFDIEALDNGCYRLFPLVAVNLQDCTKALPHRDRLFSVLRHNWVQNQRLLGQTLPLLRALQDAGIDLLVLKGAALSSLYYKHGGARPMVDLDILIHPHDLKKAAALLLELGCTLPVVLTTEHLSNLLRFRHELTFKTREGTEFDVHWYLVSDSRHPNVEASFWQDAIPCPLPGFRTKTLAQADQFLHTCLHGVQWNEVSAVRWLADAAMIIRAGLDWDRLESQARHLQRLEPVRETILYLDRLGMNLSPDVVEHWRRMEITAFEKIEGGYRASRPNPRERTKQLAWAYLRLNRNMSLFELLSHLPAYMNQIHHFRAYSRRVTFFVYLIFLAATHKRVVDVRM